MNESGQVKEKWNKISKNSRLKKIEEIQPHHKLDQYFLSVINNLT
jgi:hypothetical protein